MNNKKPVVLIYKRTHKGDPSLNGIFGIHDCMGRVRNWKYDAVIGIGGKSPWTGHEDIAYKINWIGITPTKHKGTKRGPLVSFDKFCLYEDKGPLVEKKAINLYKYMYQEPDSIYRRVVKVTLSNKFYSEVLEILKLAEKCLPSKGTSSVNKTVRKCR